MIRTISITPDKIYCFKCEKNTETTNKKKEEWKGRYVIRGNCKVCNACKVSKNFKRYGEKQKILI